MSSVSSDPHQPAREIKPRQFGLGSLLALIWTAASVLAFIRGLVVWPLWITWLILIVIIDHKVSPDLNGLRYTLGVVLLVLVLLALVVLSLLSVLAWQSRLLA